MAFAGRCDPVIPVGMVLARDLRGDTVLVRLLSVTGSGLLLQHTDAHTEYHPFSEHIGVDEVLSGYEPATAAQIAVFLSRLEGNPCTE